MSFERYLLTAALLAGLHGVATADDIGPSAAEMVNALKPPDTELPRTRSMRNLINRPADVAASAGQAQPEVPDAPPKPSISMAIQFDFGSAKLRPEGAAVLDRLAVALQMRELRSSRFLIEGHTDGKGSADYNLHLSQLRADEVLHYLVAHEVEQSRLSAIGKGATELADAAAPLAAANRRVRIVNQIAP
jgi:OOP family OmpA-OmpF porin